MKSEQFDAFSRILARSESRRSAIRKIAGVGLGTAGLAASSRISLAQDATPVAGPVALGVAQAALDALDPDTKDSIARAIWKTELKAEDLDPEILAKILDPKNSNEAFGARLGARLLELIAEPTSFVQSHAERYETLLPYCASLSPHQAYIATNLLGVEQSKGYRIIPEVANLQFPQNNAMDLQSQLGWYFCVGSATDTDGQEYGIEMMFFRYAMLPPELAAQLGLTDAENQIIELHFAIAEAGKRHFQAKPITIAGTTGLLTFDTEGLGATMGKNVFKSLSPDSPFPLHLEAWGQDDGGQEPLQFSIDLTFSTGNDYLLQLADGCAPCCDGVGTLYYSIPNLILDGAASTMVLQGKEITLTEGTFWFDHQWGMLSAVAQSEALRAVTNLSPAGPGGWDWFEAQFYEDRQITAYSAHTNDYLEFYFQTGPTPPGTMTVPAHAKYAKSGATQDVEGTLSITDWILSVDSPDPVMYPPTYTWYPNQWEFAFGEDVPEDIRTFIMKPIVSTGQSGFFSGGAQYSEGAVYLLDPDGNDLGRGFAESVGYAKTEDNKLRIVGIPATDDMLALFGNIPVGPGMLTASQAYAYLNAKEVAEKSGMCLGIPG